MIHFQIIQGGYWKQNGAIATFMHNVILQEKPMVQKGGIPIVLHCKKSQIRRKKRCSFPSCRF